MTHFTIYTTLLDTGVSSYYSTGDIFYILLLFFQFKSPESPSYIKKIYKNGWKCQFQTLNYTLTVALITWSRDTPRGIKHWHLLAEKDGSILPLWNYNRPCPLFSFIHTQGILLLLVNTRPNKNENVYIRVVSDEKISQLWLNFVKNNQTLDDIIIIMSWSYDLMIIY